MPAAAFDVKLRGRAHQQTRLRLVTAAGISVVMRANSQRVGSITLTRLVETLHSGLPPPTEKMSGIVPGKTRYSQPFDEGGVPALIVGTRGKFRDIVGRRIGLNSPDLEVVQGITSITGEPPTPRLNNLPPRARTAGSAVICSMT